MIELMTLVNDEDSAGYVVMKCNFLVGCRFRIRLFDYKVEIFSILGSVDVILRFY